MNRTHDVGGTTGWGPIERETDEPAFHAEWEARVFALNRILLGCGQYTLDQFRATVEAIDPEHYRSLSYYERWLTAIEKLVAEHGTGG